MPEIRTSAERLERVRETLEGFQGARAACRAARRQDLSRGQNLLLGAALHAAARLEQGLEPTMLEEQLLQMLRAWLRTTTRKSLPGGACSPNSEPRAAG